MSKPGSTSTPDRSSSVQGAELLERARKLAEQALGKSYGLSPSGLVPDAVVLHSSEPRYQAAFDEFVKSLGVQNPVRIVVPNGVQDLTAGISGSSLHAIALARQISQVVKENKISRVILLHHEDCPVYGRMTRLIKIKTSSDAVASIVKGIEKLIEKHLQVDLEFYLATPSSDEKVVTFKRMDAK